MLVFATAAQAQATGQSAGETYWTMTQEVAALGTARPTDPQFIPGSWTLGDDTSPFKLYPDFVSSVSFDDNVYRLRDGVGPGRQSDFLFTESPTLVLDYQSGPARLDAYADATINEYTKLSGVDNTEYDVGLRQFYAIAPDAQLSANVSYSRNAQPMSSPDNIGLQARPTLYNDLNASAQLKYQPGPIGLVVGFNTDFDRYEPTPLIGGLPLDLSFRNDNIYRGFVEADYDFLSHYEAFVRATYTSDQYENEFDFAGIHRSSTDEAYDGGLKLLLANDIQGQVYLGYLSNHYDQHQINPLSGLLNRVPDVSGLDFGASLTWFPTDALSLHLATQRTLSDTTIPGASVGDDKGVTLSGEYILTRRWHFTLAGSFDDARYNTIPTDEFFRTVSFGAGTKWFISHNVQMTLAYTYSKRWSNVNALGTGIYNYDDNLATLALNLQL